MFIPLFNTYLQWTHAEGTHIGVKEIYGQPIREAKTNLPVTVKDKTCPELSLNLARRQPTIHPSLLTNLAQKHKDQLWLTSIKWHAALDLWLWPFTAKLNQQWQTDKINNCCLRLSWKGPLAIYLSSLLKSIPSWSFCGQRGHTWAEHI